MQDRRPGRPDAPSAAEGARRCRGPRVGTVHRAWDVLRGVQAEWEGQHGQEHCVGPPPNLHPTDHHACSLPPPLAPPPRPHHRCACVAAATTHRHCSAKNVWTTAPCRNKTPAAAIRAHSEGRKVPGPLPTSPCPHYGTCCATCLSACLSVPATLYMLLTDPPACRPTDRTTHVPTHLSTGHSLLDPPTTHTHAHPAAEAGSQKAEERPRKTWEADGAGLHGVRLLRGR